MKGSRWKKGGKISVPFFRFMKKKPSRPWFSGALFSAVAGLCVITGVHSRYELTEERKVRSIRSRNIGSVLKLLGIVCDAYVMTVVRGAGRNEKESSC